MSTITRLRGASSRSARIARTPSRRGITRSIRITSGASRGANCDRLLAVGGLAHDLDPVLELQERAQALADHGVVVDDQHPDRLSRHRGHLQPDGGPRPGR